MMLSHRFSKLVLCVVSQLICTIPRITYGFSHLMSDASYLLYTDILLYDIRGFILRLHIWTSKPAQRAGQVQRKRSGWLRQPVVQTAVLFVIR